MRKDPRLRASTGQRKPWKFCVGMRRGGRRREDTEVLTMGHSRSKDGTTSAKTCLRAQEFVHLVVRELNIHCRSEVILSGFFSLCLCLPEQCRWLAWLLWCLYKALSFDRT